MLQIAPTPQPSSRVAAYDFLARECRETFQAKNQDYGDSFREDGLIGVFIRLKDKINRALNLLDHENEYRMVRSETLRDTLLDYSNYCLMGVVVYDLDRPGLIAATCRRIMASMGVSDSSIPAYENLQREQRVMYLSGDCLGGLQRHGLAVELTRAKQTVIHWLAKARLDGELDIWKPATRHELLSLSLIPLEAIIRFEEGGQ